MKAVLKTLLLLGVLTVPTIASAQDYPSRQVTMVIPFPPGGTNDLFGRYLADGLTKLWGKTVVTENRPGGGTAIGAGHVVRAKPDGYTLMFVSSSYTSNAAMQQNLPFDPIKDLQPVGMAAYGDRFVITGSRVPMATLKDMQREAKARKIFYSTSGAGTLSHLSGELLNDVLGVDMEAVHYQGGAPAMTDLMAGHVNLLFASVLEGSGHIRSGKLKGLAVTHARRSPALPEVPTLAEAGVKDAESGSWIALLAPAGTPQAVIERVGDDVKEVISAPDVRDKLVAQGAVPQASTPRELQALIEKDRLRYGRIIREKNLKAE